MSAATGEAANMSAADPVSLIHRPRYLLFLLALSCLQTAARIAFSPRAPGWNWIAAGLHVGFLSVFFMGGALVAAPLPQRWRGFPVAAAVTAVALGSAHATMTLFDAIQYYTRYNAGMD